MRKYRRIVWREGSKFQGYQISLISLVCFILLFSVLSYWLYLNHYHYQWLAFLKRTLHILIGISLCGVIISLLMLYITYHQREQTAVYVVDTMNKTQQRVANRIKRLFNDKQIIDVLKLSNTTRFGEEMPEIFVWINEDLDYGYVAIENIMNFNKLDKSKYEQVLSGLFSGKYQRLSVVSSYLDAGDSFMVFVFEDTVSSKRFVLNHPENVENYVSKNEHDIRLAEDLIWHTDETPHMSIIARTRAGKSMFTGGFIAPLMEAQGWDIEYHSVKRDNYVAEYNGESSAEAIVERAEYWCNVMDDRMHYINAHGEDTYLRVEGLINIGLFFDEIGNLNGQLDANRSLKKRWESSITRLTATGASTGIHIIAISQFGTTQGFLPTTAKVNCSDAVIMLGGAADSANERQYLMSGFAEMPQRNYQVGQGVARFNTSGVKWQTPHYYETPWFKWL